MTKRLLVWLVPLLVILMALPVLAQDAEMEAWTCPEGFEGQTLSIFNWGTYISDEDNLDTADVNENLIQNFEELCGVTVIYDGTMESSEALLARLRGGNPGYDLAMPTGYIIPILVEEQLIAPINMENVPNAANINPNLANPWYDPEQMYSLPYFWGTIAIGYNYADVGEEITSWEQFFTYDGPVSWLEDRRSVIGIALLNLGLNPNSEDPAEIEQAVEFLIANSGNVVTIAQDDGQVLLARGDVDMTIEYNGDIFQIAAECAENPDCTDDFRFVIPEEGAVRWADNMVIPAFAPNQALAEVFIDYMYDPMISAINANFVQYGSPNALAVEMGLIDEALLTNPGIYPTEEIDALLFEVLDMPDAEILYSDAWEEVKLAIGQ
ncbi:MAG: spermidine/putrescine ABC transporter substrate-binding protein [Chloroflexota bacterium]|nr:spermidine/putrescine ABC transporter substrate-binding protein [Chloroflexota bacterium]